MVGKKVVCPLESTYWAVRSFSMLSDRLALMLLVTIVAAPTRAVPIMSALAVAAVRRGLRSEFCRASRPTVPASATDGTEISHTTGRAMSGAAIATPKNTPSTPPPTHQSGLRTSTNSPVSRAATPAAASTRPIRARIRICRSGSATSSRSAATGATREARIAGSIAETTVAMTPARTVTTTVVASTGNPPEISKPNPPTTLCSAKAMSRPRPRPITLPIRPTASASTRTASST